MSWGGVRRRVLRRMSPLIDWLEGGINALWTPGNGWALGIEWELGIEWGLAGTELILGTRVGWKVRRAEEHIVKWALGTEWALGSEWAARKAEEDVASCDEPGHGLDVSGGQPNVRRRWWVPNKHELGVVRLPSEAQCESWGLRSS